MMNEDIKISYAKLREILTERKITWEEVRSATGISPTVHAKINKNQYVSLKSMALIAHFLKVQIGDLVEIKYS